MSSEEALIRALLDGAAEVSLPTTGTGLRESRSRAIGAVYPRVFAAAAASGPDRWRVSTELLVRGARPRLSVEPRFLHVVDRTLFRRVEGGRLEETDELVVADERIIASEEARERAVVLAGVRLEADGDVRMPIEIGAGSEREDVVGGTILRRWAALAGELQVRWCRLADGLLRVGVTVSNGYSHRVSDRNEANRHAFLAVHVFLSVESGAFVSSLEPPKNLELAVLGCRNDGLFPVLLGKGGAPRDRVLASPVVLYQPDRLALGRLGADGSGGTREPDAAITSRVLTEADAVRADIRLTEAGADASPDPRTAAVSDATLRLHGAIRDWQVLNLIGSMDEPTTEMSATFAGATPPGGR